MLERIKKPWIIVGIAMIIYNALKQAGIEIPQDDFRFYVDILSYIILGYAVYTDHGTKEGE